MYRSFEETVPKSQIERFLAGQDTYTKYRRIQRKYPRIPTMTAGLDDRWQMDLMTISKSSRSNDRNNYVLLAIDILSRFAFARPIRSKNCRDVATAFKSIIEESGRRKPSIVTTDCGLEFRGPELKRLLKSFSIRQVFTIPNRTKNSVVERLIRTLREKISRYLYHVNSERFIHVLPEIISAYNHSFHRSIGMSPADVVSSKANQQLAYFNLFSGSQRPSSTRLKIDDSIRIPKILKIFDKPSQSQKWSNEKFNIREMNMSVKDRPFFHVDTIPSLFYPEQMVRTNRKTAT